MARELAPRRVVQGNLDPLLLVAGGEAMERRVAEILAAHGGRPLRFQPGPRHRAADAARRTWRGLVELVRRCADGIAVIPAVVPSRSSHKPLSCAGGSGDKRRDDEQMLLWLKALHVIAVIAWMAGLLYLPRLFVYHCAAETGSKQSETFKVMEHRLLRLIMNPAMIVVWVTGPWLAWAQGMLHDRWLWAKFGLVVLLTGYHHALGAGARTSPRTATVRRPRFFRIANEVPTLLMVGIVVLVVVKPF